MLINIFIYLDNYFKVQEQIQMMEMEYFDIFCSSFNNYNHKLVFLHISHFVPWTMEHVLVVFSDMLISTAYLVIRTDLAFTQMQ